VAYPLAAPIEGGRALAAATMSQDGFVRLGMGGADSRPAPHACHLGPTGDAALRTRAIGASPSGDRVVVAMGGFGASPISLWTARTDCSEARLVMADVGRADWVNGLRWITRPDGDALYVLMSDARFAATLVRLPLTGEGGPRGPIETLATDLDAVHGPIVSPQGEVAFLRMDLSSNLYWYRRSPAARVALTSDTARRSLPTLSHDGQYVALEEHVGRRARLVVLHLPDGRERTSFTLDRGGKIIRLAWSPDDHALLASQSKDDGEGRLTIYSLDGAPPHDLEDGLYGAFTGGVDWAPDGRLLVPTWDGQGAYWWNLATGQGEGMLAREPYVGQVTYVEVSDDGALVAAWWKRAPIGLYLISAWTGEARLLVPGKATDFIRPLAFSAGDEYLYYTWNTTDPEDSGTAWIRRVRIGDGTVEDWWKAPTDDDGDEVALDPVRGTAVGLVGLGRRDIWVVNPG
jgi:WD40 repeat protein